VKLPPELRSAAVAAAALAVSLVLPWYEKSFVPPGGREFRSDSVSAFGVFSWVEAAVLLVAAGVLYLVWARAQGKGFHLPGGDGLVVSLAGGWALGLLAWRLFDRPEAEGGAATVGISWGVIGPGLAAAALVVIGGRLRAAHRPEPPNPAEGFEWEAAPERRERAARSRPVDSAAVKEVLRDRPRWEGDPPE
jgi:hypothetical protein